MCVAACALAVAAAAGAARAVDADLAASVSASPASVAVGGSVTYTAGVEEVSPETASGVSVTVTLSGPKATIASAVPDVAGARCSIATSKRSVRCTIGALNSGQTSHVTVTAVTAGAGSLVGSAKVRSRYNDPNAANDVAQVTTPVTESDAPVATPPTSSSFEREFTTRRAISLSWRATDTGSGVASYDVRYRAAPPSGGFGEPVTWLSGTDDKRATFTGRAGTTYCFSVRATDRDGNASPWSDERCASVAVPASGFARTGGWLAVGTRGVLRSSARAAALRLGPVAARRLVATLGFGPRHGRVLVSWNGRPLKTIDLAAATRASRDVVVAAFPGLRRGVLALKVVSARGTVVVDALGIAKR